MIINEPTVSVKPLVTDRLNLREFELSDARSLFGLYSLHETSEFESWDPHTRLVDSEGLAAYWVESQTETSRDEYTFAIDSKIDGQFIGICGLTLGFGTETDDPRVGFLGYRLHPNCWRQGLATEAATAVLKFGFEVLALHRIHTGCSADNKSSVRVIEKLGFRHEGTSIKSFPIGDRWSDYHRYGMLSDECAL